ncbi:50S ribosomal protein L11 methyltransferase [Candidatus Marinimicrobia bacterium]|nr:50S ribosomal protein L11 methyltransferase [Candidatus Neomarinimicrobiota bacterium]
MNRPSTYWNVLSLIGEREIIEIISSLTQSESLGVIDTDQQLSLFFNPEAKSEIDDLINSLNKLHNFDFKWTIQQIEPWHLSWKDNFTPIYIRDKIAIIPDWQNDLPNYEHVIKIRPGMAFGTGHHETTYLMMEAMLKYNISGKSVLDLGTGSGILAIAAKSLGAKQIIGLEYDPVCEENFIENLELNNMSKINFVKGDATKWMNFNFDIILANINRNILLDIIPNMKNAIGTIILSGLLNNDETMVRQVCDDNGLNVKTVNVKGEWISMELAVA